MSHSKLKIFLSMTVCLMFLFAPFFLDISLDGKAYAFSSKKGNKRHAVASPSEAGGPSTFGFDEREGSKAPAPVPEPATWLLVGAGAAGLAAYKKKFRKK
jgi:hypothetical protein